MPRGIISRQIQEHGMLPTTRKSGSMKVKNGTNIIHGCKIHYDQEVTVEHLIWQFAAYKEGEKE
jgi:hypothetical protein